MKQIYSFKTEGLEISGTKERLRELLSYIDYEDEEISDALAEIITEIKNTFLSTTEFPRNIVLSGTDKESFILEFLALYDGHSDFQKAILLELLPQFGAINIEKFNQSYINALNETTQECNLISLKNGKLLILGPGYKELETSLLKNLPKELILISTDAIILTLPVASDEDVAYIKEISKRYPNLELFQQL